MLRRAIECFVSSCPKEMLSNHRREKLVEDSACELAVGGVWTLRNRESVPDGGRSISRCEHRARLNLTGVKCRRRRVRSRVEKPSLWSAVIWEDSWQRGEERGGCAMVRLLHEVETGRGGKNVEEEDQRLGN